MRFSSILLLAIIACLHSFAFATAKVSAPKTTLSGKITDKNTGETLVGVFIYVPDLRSGAATGIDGRYQINNLPATKVLVKVSMVGYKTIVELVDLSVTIKKDFVLEESIIDINEVVVTGTSRSTEIKKNPVPIIAIDRKEMDQNLSTNVIDAIAKLPGINAVSTGPNVSKPFIRGLGYNRVLTLFDGVRQEGQQWGDEHGIEVDENAVDRIEIIKGPASLMYGSDALAGVVNLLPAFPVPDGTIQGSAMTNYQSNNGLYAGSFSLAGNNKGFIWGGRGSYKQAANYQSKNDGRVYGTSFQETNANGYVGLNKQWGYSHLNFSHFDALQSIPDGSRDSSSRKFTKQISDEDTLRDIVSNSELNSYTIPSLHQRVQHSRIYLSNNFVFGESKLSMVLGYQQSVRKEFSHPLSNDIAGLHLILDSYTYTIKYFLPEFSGWETTLGLNGMYQLNKNKGTEFTIPNFSLFDIGPFAHVKKTFDKLDLSAGFRYDQRSFNTNELFTRLNTSTGFNEQVVFPDTAGSTQSFYAYQNTFGGLSGSIGATYNFSDYFLVKGNIARGYRTPNIVELSSNGVHPGTNIYQVGNSSFKPEFSLQEDIGIFFSSEHISGSIEVFNNTIRNYIYNQKLLSVNGGDSIILDGNRSFQFQSSNAQLYGGEFSLDIHPHPLDWLHFENSISVIYAVNKGNGGAPVPNSEKYLPLIPPLHTNSEIRIDAHKKWKRFSSFYAKIGFQYYATQTRAYFAYNTETETPGYFLFDAGIGSDINSKSGKKLVSIHLLGNNITDLVYQSHLSRLKYFEDYSLNSGSNSGIYNMGRNISFKLQIPLNFKK